MNQVAGIRVGVLLYPGCTIAEVVLLTTRLADGGAELAYLAPTVEPIVDRSGLRLGADERIGEAGPLDLLVIPGGDPGSIMDDDEVAAFVRDVADAGAIVAGICAGVLVMARAGVLAGRRATHNYRAPWAPAEIESFVAEFWADVLVESDPRTGVVVDDRLVTALPNATIDFAMTVSEMLGVVDKGEVALLGRHLRGEFVDELHTGD